MRIGVVSVACGTTADGLTCKSSRIRDDAAVQLAIELVKTGHKVVIIPTGSIPRIPGDSLTLVYLKELHIASELFRAGRSEIKVVIAKKGYDSFSEARYVAGTMVKDLGLEQLIVVSSDWYMPYGGTIWRRACEANGVWFRAHPVITPAGEKTVELYKRNARWLNAAIFFGLALPFEWAVRYLTRSRKTRGIPWSCGD